MIQGNKFAKDKIINGWKEIRKLTGREKFDHYLEIIKGGYAILITGLQKCLSPPERNPGKMNRN